jgi:hypothetical protein
MSGSLSTVGGFWARFPLKKLGCYFVFFLSNKNSGKAFVVPSKKEKNWMLSPGWNRLVPRPFAPRTTHRTRFAPCASAPRAAHQTRLMLRASPVSRATPRLMPHVARRPRLPRARVNLLCVAASR